MNRTNLIEEIIKRAPKYADGVVLREALLRLGDLEIASIAFDMGIGKEKTDLKVA